MSGMFNILFWPNRHVTEAPEKKHKSQINYSYYLRLFISHLIGFSHNTINTPKIILLTSVCGFLTFTVKTVQFFFPVIQKWMPNSVCLTLVSILRKLTVTEVTAAAAAVVVVVVALVRNVHKNRKFISHHPFHLQGYLPSLSDKLWPRLTLGITVSRDLNSQ